MKAKVCVVLSQGWIAEAAHRRKFLQLQEINCMASAAEMLPKCLKEECEIWVPTQLLTSGHCGLKK